MSTISIQFEVQPLDFGSLVRGDVRFTFAYGGTVNPMMIETLSQYSTQVGQFQEVEWFFPTLSASAQQAANYAFAFNRDYKNIGGVKNLFAQVSPTASDTVIITAKTGTFSSFSYTGNVLVVQSSITNTAQAGPIAFSVTPSASGNCSTITYDATATGDDTPFKITVDGVEVVTGWNGTATTFIMLRSAPHTVRLLDSSGAVISSKSIITPRKLAASEFQEAVTQYPTYSDVIIQKTVTIANTEPLEYALTATGEVTGGGYQSSNAFAGIAPDTYRLWIKDKYGCEVSRLITISALQDPTVIENLRYFLIPEGQSVQFSEFETWTKDIKKNHFNTNSFNEFVPDERYCISQFFDPSDWLQGIQFQSSYDYHRVTLHDMDGNMVDVPPIMIQQNLGVVEKVDCGLWPVGTKTGVYFNGGDSYLPDTTTTLPDPSPYNSGTPRWGKVGQLVAIDGVGSFYIEQTGYDSDRGGYFIVDTVTPTETTGLIQATYNAHPYNLWETYFNPADLTSKSFLVIEKGLDEVEVEGNPYVSEVISAKTDAEDDVRVVWTDSKNRGNLVFQSGITYLFRRNGHFYGDFTNTEAEVYAGDDQVYSLDQAAFLDFTLRFEMLSAKQVNMLNIASGVEIFNVNGINLVRKESPTITRLGETNMHTWQGRFAYGGNQLGVQQDEIVLSVSTGIIGGGSTGVGEAPDLSGIILFKNEAGQLLQLNGNLSKQ